MIKVLGIDNVAFLRLRRDRYGSVLSHVGSRLTFVLENNRNAILRATDDQWRQLTTHQRYLWAIDELEARWQRLLANNPGVHALEINWDSSIRPADIDAVGELLHCDMNASLPHAHNHFRNVSSDYQSHIESDIEYHRVMQYTDEQRRMIAMVQQFW